MQIIQRNNAAWAVGLGEHRHRHRAARASAGHHASLPGRDHYAGPGCQAAPHGADKRGLCANGHSHLQATASVQRRNGRQHQQFSSIRRQELRLAYDNRPGRVSIAIVLLCPAPLPCYRRAPLRLIRWANYFLPALLFASDLGLFHQLRLPSDGRSTYLLYPSIFLSVHYRYFAWTGIYF